MTQKTPKGEEMPVPKCRDFLKNLKTVATPKPSVPRSPKKQRLEQRPRIYASCLSPP
ncbi:MAG: hypothetical protein IIC90_04610 [Chloroflexi bacterium]|nr:hypothetical protein [Chloroflexota bacterium]